MTPISIPPSSSLPPVPRRRFLQQTGGLTALALGAAAVTEVTAAPAVRTARRNGKRPRIALLGTEVRKHSHAQHFIDRFLEGYGWQGRHYHSPVDLVSLYIDQHPDGDLTPDRVQRHHVPTYPTIAEALTCGGSKLDVDGVVIIAEHGKYARNEKGQTRYPRYQFFKEVVRQFERDGRAVPVFNDKHLSTVWSECEEMVQDSRRLDFAFLAGSSLPVTWRIPSIDLPYGAKLTESVCACYGGVDSYDFHGLETAQCMSERRAGGEVGLRSIWALKGAKAWAELAKREQTTRLLLAALARSHTLRAPDGYTAVPPTPASLASLCPDMVAYFMEHQDGFQSSMFLLNGLISDFNYAGIEGRSGKIHSCQMHLPMPGSISTTADFFNPLVNHIERTIVQRRASYPVERTLLTSGMTLAAVESLFRGEVPVATPEMAVRYRAPRESTFWRA